MPKQPMSFSVELSLPEWTRGMRTLLRGSYADDEQKMRVAIDLARRNVLEGTGGPFGAAIFDAGTGRLVSIGVNRVVPLHNSTAHAEMMAFMLAQQRLRRHRLDDGRHDFVLVTSAQPCAMCYGACPWAGINRLIIAARKEDVENLTEFDEGPLPRNWIQGLRRRGIRVTRDVLRREACEVLASYQAQAGHAY